MGEISTRLADYTIITSDNPRTESPSKIVQQVERGARSAASAEVLTEPDRHKAIELALKTAMSGDVVLILGKGHEPHQIIGKARYPFDDRVVARELLQGMGYCLKSGRTQ